MTVPLVFLAAAALASGRPASLPGATVPAGGAWLERPVERSGQPAGGSFEYRVLATTRASTMQKEVSEAAAAGFRLVAIMSGETAGAEAVAIVGRPTGETKDRYEYKLLMSKPATLQKELQEAADRGFDYRGQAVFRTAFGGREGVVFLERDREAAETRRWQYRVIVSGRTAATERELAGVAGEGFEVVGVGLAPTDLGGAELVTIVRRPASP